MQSSTDGDLSAQRCDGIGRRQCGRQAADTGTEAGRRSVRQRAAAAAARRGEGRRPHVLLLLSLLRTRLSCGVGHDGQRPATASAAGGSSADSCSIASLAQQPIAALHFSLWVCAHPPTRRMPELRRGGSRRHNAGCAPSAPSPPLLLRLSTRSLTSHREPQLRQQRPTWQPSPSSSLRAQVSLRLPLPSSQAQRQRSCSGAASSAAQQQATSSSPQ